MKSSCKRFSSILLLVFVFMSFHMATLSAVTLEEYSDPSSWIPTRFMVGAGNDKWTSGISFNLDDQLSFGEYFAVEAPAWKLNVNMLGITNRGWQNGWSVEDFGKDGDGHRISGRYDVTEFLFSLPLEVFYNGSIYLYLEPRFGASLVGNQHYEVLQNTLHRLLGMAEVDLAYETSGNRVFPYFGGVVEFGDEFMALERSGVFAAVKGTFESTFGFDHRQRADFVVGLENVDSDILTFSLGYQWAETVSDWETSALYDEYVRGLSFGYTVDSGFLRYNYISSLRSLRGYSTILVDVMSLFKPSMWDETDIRFTIGKTSMMNVSFVSVGLEFPLGGAFSFIVRNRYVSGNPSYKDDPKTGVDSSEFGRYQRNYDGTFVGAKYTFDSQSTGGFVTPYAEACVGFMRWESRHLVNMNEKLVTDYGYDPSTGEFYPIWETNFRHSYSTGRLYSFSMDFELGLTILPEGLVKSSSTTFQLNLYAGATFIHNPKAVMEHVYDFTPDDDKMASLMPRFGLSIQMGFDI